MTAWYRRSAAESSLCSMRNDLEGIQESLLNRFGAVTAYLKEPRSLTVAMLSPPWPIPIMLGLELAVLTELRVPLC